MTVLDPRYGAEVRRRMAALTGAGTLATGDDVATGRAGDREQGARLVLDFRVVDGRAAEVRFRAFGCPHLIAAASWITDRMLGARREDLERWDWREAAEVLAVPPAKYGRLLTVQDAIRDAARNWPGAPKSTV